MDTLNQQVTKSRKNFSILKWLLIVGITVVSNLFFNYAINSLYKEPKFEAYCPQKQLNIQPVDSKVCIAQGGSWTENADTAQVIYPDQPSKVYVQPKGYCDENFTCRKNFDEASKVYNRNVFIILIILGVISLVVGFFLSEITVVSLGLSFGGVLSLIIGSMRYWSDMNDYLRVSVLGVALIALIYLGVKKIKD
ncbi:hypothetical protein IT397_02495 [Candidatus Nomurabacteria bacterium]|nr:hypothetical protein [Candidatus Nomurabacteria bacterium]